MIHDSRRGKAVLPCHIDRLGRRIRRKRINRVDMIVDKIGLFWRRNLSPPAHFIDFGKRREPVVPLRRIQSFNQKLQLHL